MSKLLKLQVISQEKKMLDVEVERVSLPTTQGEITVLPHHTAIFAKLQTGQLRFTTTDHQTSSLVISQGFVSVSQAHNEVKVLVDSATHERDLSVTAAQKAIAEAQTALANTQDRQEMLLIEAQLKKAAWELRIAQQTRKSAI